LACPKKHNTPLMFLTFGVSHNEIPSQKDVGGNSTQCHSKIANIMTEQVMRQRD
jgi:hypothetical protein